MALWFHEKKILNLKYGQKVNAYFFTVVMKGGFWFFDPKEIYFMTREKKKKGNTK